MERLKQTTTTKPEIKLVGICVRTSYQQELDKINGHIFSCIRRYFHESLAEKIPNRAKPGTTFCAYTDYETDHLGAYTYFIGEEVTSFDELPKDFQTLNIPKQHYTKFTTDPTPMPQVIVNTWETIWSLSPKQLGGKRRYHTDFEIYDERAADHQNIILDVYIGVAE